MVVIISLAFSSPPTKCILISWQPLVLVESQCTPDPEFRTVRFPNPEEPSSLELSLKTADQHGSTLVLANDPDADRLAVAEKSKE